MRGTGGQQTRTYEVSLHVKLRRRYLVCGRALSPRRSGGWCPARRGEAIPYLLRNCAWNLHNLTPFNTSFEAQSSFPSTRCTSADFIASQASAHVLDKPQPTSTERLTVPCRHFSRRSPFPPVRSRSIPPCRPRLMTLTTATPTLTDVPSWAPRLLRR